MAVRVGWLAIMNLNNLKLVKLEGLLYVQDSEYGFYRYHKNINEKKLAIRGDLYPA